MKRLFCIFSLFLILSTFCWGQYWTGDGGKGKSIGILLPESQSFSSQLLHIPTLVQGYLVTNISKYSAISVLDRVALDKVINETLDPTYEDNEKIIRLGHIAHVSLMMTARIISISTGYTLQINVTDTKNAQTVASFSGNFSLQQLEDQTAVKLASKELLTQIGVLLTSRAIDELGKPEPRQNINAQTLLAQGITAENMEL
jgi:hypothetical protein